MDPTTLISKSLINSILLNPMTSFFLKLTAIIFLKLKIHPFRILNKIYRKIYLRTVWIKNWFLIAAKVKEIVFKNTVKKIKKSKLVRNLLIGKGIIILKKSGIIKKGILNLKLGEIIKIQEHEMNRLKILRMNKIINKLNSEFSLIY